MTEHGDHLSLDYWINYCTFGVAKDYKEQPYYKEAQKIWSSIKCSLLDIYKDKPNVVEFIHNITLINFHEKDDCYTIVGVVKMNYNTNDDPEYNYKHFCFIYDPIMLIQKQITITDYDGFTIDMGMFFQYDYMLDTDDQDAIDKELYDNFRTMTGYKDVRVEDFSTIFNNLLGKGWTKNNHNLLGKGWTKIPINLLGNLFR